MAATIAPGRLLSTLRVLLSPTGGIKSSDEVRHTLLLNKQNFVVFGPSLPTVQYLKYLKNIYYHSFCTVKVEI